MYECRVCGHDWVVELPSDIDPSTIDYSDTLCPECEEEENFAVLDNSPKFRRAERTDRVTGFIGLVVAVAVFSIPWLTGVAWWCGWL